MSGNVQTSQEKPSVFKIIIFLFNLIWQVSSISTLAHKTYTDERLTTVNFILLLLSISYCIFTVYAFLAGTQKEMSSKVKRVYKRCKNLGTLYSWCVMLYIWFTAKNLSFIAVILIIIMSIAFIIGLLLDLLFYFLLGFVTKRNNQN